MNSAQNYFVFFSLCQASALVLYRLVLSCIVLNCFCSFKGVQQVPGFCLPLHLLHPVIVVFNDFDVIWFCIFDGNKDWTELMFCLILADICWEY